MFRKNKAYLVTYNIIIMTRNVSHGRKTKWRHLRSLQNFGHVYLKVLFKMSSKHHSNIKNIYFVNVLKCFKNFLERFRCKYTHKIIQQKCPNHVTIETPIIFSINLSLEIPIFQNTHTHKINKKSNF